jgi:hypothetical protein
MPNPGETMEKEREFVSRMWEEDDGSRDLKIKDFAVYVTAERDRQWLAILRPLVEALGRIQARGGGGAAAGRASFVDACNAIDGIPPSVVEQLAQLRAKGGDR